MRKKKPLSPFPYKHIIWDWNGTLLNDSQLCVSVINRILSKRGMATIDHRTYTRIFGFPVIDYYKRLGFDFEVESFEIIGTEFFDGYEAKKHELELQCNALQVLSFLINRGVTHSILSAYKQETLDELINHFQLENIFLKIIGLDNHYAHSKIENGIRWISELSYDRSEVLLVGDTEHDFEAAQAMGVDCILVAGGHQMKRTLEATGSRVIDGLEGLIVEIQQNNDVKTREHVTRSLLRPC